VGQNRTRTWLRTEVTIATQKKCRCNTRDRTADRSSEEQDERRETQRQKERDEGHAEARSYAGQATRAQGVPPYPASRAPSFSPCPALPSGVTAVACMPPLLPSLPVSLRSNNWLSISSRHCPSPFASPPVIARLPSHLLPSLPVSPRSNNWLRAEGATALSSGLTALTNLQSIDIRRGRGRRRRGERDRGDDDEGKRGGGGGMDGLGWIDVCENQRDKVARSAPKRIRGGRSGLGGIA
jgi:hypothetical protein